MSAWIVRFGNDNEGWADETFYGPFRSKATAKALEHKLQAKLDALRARGGDEDGDLRITSWPVYPPLVGHFVDELKRHEP